MQQVYTCVLLLCLVAFSQTAAAQATLSIQGIIQKSNGQAVDDGTYDLTFKLYPTTSGGAAVHSETQTIAVAGGIYSAELGGGGTPLAAAFDQTYYLGVSVDGGAELVPRTRLTSSPYALSLLGTSNLFPSSGAIGAGTVSPATGFGLHLFNGSGVGKQLIEGTDGAFLNFTRTGWVTGSIGFGNNNNNFIINPAGETEMQFNGSTKLQVTTNGVNVPGTLNAGTLTASSFSPANMAITAKLAVGQSAVDANNTFKVNGSSFLNGNTYVGGFMEINGGTSYNPGQAVALGSAGVANVPSATNVFSLKVSNFISGPGYFVTSDRRIKKDFHLSENMADLSTLQKLRVTDYRHMDTVQNGTAFKKGFIAQEVEEIYPEAVSQSENFIPNVYALSTRAQLDAGKMSIFLEKNHDLMVGDMVKLMLPDGEKKAVVAAVLAENAFSINWDEAAAPEKIFVFGKKVKDFRTVDYDRIFTLNVSATQELARQVMELQQENKQKDKQIGEMKASAEKFDARLRALENRISN